MQRLPDLDTAALTPEQKRVYDDVAAAHGGHVRGPWAIALRDPELLYHAHKLYDRLCTGTKLGERLFELMVLTVARHWTSQFEWATHERKAREVGVPPAIIEAIRHNRVPHFEHQDEQIVYDIVIELEHTTQLSTPSYERARAFFGEDLLVELISAAGLYTMIAMLLNAFDAPIPATVEPLK
jgi:4-carboxymuconolactone decarboxylase